MATPRRRLVRPANPSTPSPQHQLRVQKLRASVERERAALTRRMARLRRAFHAVEKSQQRIARWERQLTKTEEADGPDHRGGRVADRRDHRAD
jgi:hypothetical protein